MNNQTIFIIIIIFLVIGLAKIYIIRNKNLEHLTVASDEAIQNLSSLYNKDQLTIGKLQLGDKFIVSGVDADDTFKITKVSDKSLVDIAAKNITATDTKTDKIYLGKKWLISGVGDFYANDDWLRFSNSANTGYGGGIAATRLWTTDNTINGRNIFDELDALRRDVDASVKIGGRYGFHRGHNNSIIWDHGIRLNGCYGNNCRG